MWIQKSLLNSKVYFSIPRHSACCKDCPGAGEGAASLKSLNWLFKLKIERERESRYELSSMLMLISWTAGAILLQRARPCLHPQRAACSNKGVRNRKDVPDVLCVQDGAIVFFFLVWGWKTFTSSFVRTGLFSIDPSLSMQERTIEFASLHWRNLRRHYPGIQYPFVHRRKLKLHCGEDKVSAAPFEHFVGPSVFD